jgi:rhomboid protease GluP
MSRRGTPDFLSIKSAVACVRMEASAQAGGDADNQVNGYARIPARSQRQAMDWSLVLASQEIHPIIEGPGQVEQSEIGDAVQRPPRWGLLVAPEHYERALAAIRQYRLENRGWSWRTELPGSAVEIHTGAIFWCLLLISWHWITTFISPGWIPLAEMNSVSVRGGEWYRLFTPILLHADLAHLMANATFGAIFLGLAMARFGWGVTLLATFMAGAAGNALGLIVYTAPYRGRGASGMMMGALGILCIQSFGLWRKNPKDARYILSGVIAGFLLFVLFGLDPDSDVMAHFGGFAAGILFGGLLALAPEERLQRTPLNSCALSLLVLTIAVTWALALR